MVQHLQDLLEEDLYRPSDQSIGQLGAVDRLISIGQFQITIGEPQLKLEVSKKHGVSQTQLKHGPFDDNPSP